MNGILSNGLKIVGPQRAEVFASRYISKLCAPALSFKVLKAFKIKESSQRCLNCSNHFEGKGSNRIETGASVEMAFNCNLLRLAGLQQLECFWLGQDVHSHRGVYSNLQTAWRDWILWRIHCRICKEYSKWHLQKNSMQWHRHLPLKA